MCVMHHLDYNSWKMQFETVCLCERWRGLATCYQLLAIKRLLKTQNMWKQAEACNRFLKN